MFEACGNIVEGALEIGVPVPPQAESPRRGLQTREDKIPAGDGQDDRALERAPLANAYPIDLGPRNKHASPANAIRADTVGVHHQPWPPASTQDS